MLTAADLAAMMRPIEPGRSARLASIDPAYSSGEARVLFEGEVELTSKGYGWLAPYSPSPGDRVLVIPVGIGGWIIVGGVTLTLTSAPGTIGVAQGGTGATTEAGARTNLSVYSKAEVDAFLVDVIDEVNTLLAAHAAEELAQRNAAIAAHAATEVTARNAAIVAALAGGTPIRRRSPDGTLWELGVGDAGETTWTEV